MSSSTATQESSVSGFTKIIDDDLVQAAAMMHELNVNSITVEKVICLGEKSNDVNAKLHPMELVLNSADNRNNII